MGCENFFLWNGNFCYGLWVVVGVWFWVVNDWWIDCELWKGIGCFFWGVVDGCLGDFVGYFGLWCSRWFFCWLYCWVGMYVWVWLGWCDLDVDKVIFFIVWMEDCEMDVE